MKMRQALISIARIAVSPYPRYSESMPLFSHQVFMPTAPITMKTEPLSVNVRPLTDVWGSIFTSGTDAMQTNQLNRLLYPLYFTTCTLCFVCTFIVLLSMAFSGAVWAQTGANEPRPALPAICQGVTAIPAAECAGLVAFYLSTNGAQWDDHTNWLTAEANVTPCQWYGIICENGHVTQIDLASNGLSGLLPRISGMFSQLTRLAVNDNQLRGDVSAGICELTDTVSTATFAYNQLLVENSRARICLNLLEPNWATTQTTPPLHLHPTAITSTTIELAWTPIAYRGDGGFYEISYSTQLNGPYTVHGVTTDKNTGAYLLNGLTPGQTHHLRVRTFTPAHTNQEQDQWSVYATTAAVTNATIDDATLLVLIYFPADNDLSPYVEPVIQRLKRGSAINPNVQVVLLADEYGDHNTVVFEIARGQITPTRLVQEKWGTDELNTSDPTVLAWFLKESRSRFPNAVRTVVSLMGHGAGLMPEYHAPTVAAAANTSLWPNPTIPALPRGVPATPGDETAEADFMSTLDYAQALAQATDNGARPFDVIFFDQCFQGNLDVLQEVQQYAQVFVASPNYAWLSAPYDRYLAAFTPATPPEEMANAITHLYQASLRDDDPENDWYPNAIFWVRKQDLAAIAAALNDLANVLQVAVQNGADAPILEAALHSQFVDTTDCGRHHLELGPPDELLGVGSFTRNLRRLFIGQDEYGVIQAAERLLNALANVRGLARVGRPYIAPDEIWNYEDTLTILAPLQRETTAATIWRASIYTESSPLNAIWAPTPGTTVNIETAFAGARNGNWDNFISQWYGHSLPPTVGSWCHYTPPVQLTSEVTETLTLTLTAETDTLQFYWSPTSHEQASEYWLLAQSADFNWQLVETFALTQTSYLVQRPAADQSYEFKLEARSAEGLIVAHSAVLAYAPVTPTPEQRVYLPLVGRGN
jgi:hypothetical protein